MLICGVSELLLSCHVMVSMNPKLPHSSEPQSNPRSTSSKWAWVITHASIFGADEHPCTTYFDVHQGYKVLTHSQVPAPCQLPLPPCRNSRMASPLPKRSAKRKAFSRLMPFTSWRTAQPSLPTASIFFGKSAVERGACGLLMGLIVLLPKKKVSCMVGDPGSVGVLVSFKASRTGLSSAIRMKLPDRPTRTNCRGPSNFGPPGTSRSFPAAGPAAWGLLLSEKARSDVGHV